MIYEKQWCSFSMKEDESKAMICETILHFGSRYFEEICERTLKFYHSTPPYYIRKYKISVAQIALVKFLIMKDQWNKYIVLVSDSNFLPFSPLMIPSVMYPVSMCLNFLSGSVLGVLGFTEGVSLGRTTPMRSEPNHIRH